jgi:U3-containing 90S pre-ribosomal complex subunit
MPKPKVVHTGPAAHNPPPDAPIPSSSKKRKYAIDVDREKAVGQKQPKKAAICDGGDDLIANGLNHAFAKMDSLLLSDYVAQRVRRFGGDLSQVEMEDKYIPGK